MPETFGKRQRGTVKARKAAARDERRQARNRRKANREAGEPEDWLATPEYLEGDTKSGPAEQPEPSEQTAEGKTGPEPVPEPNS
jgi:hypothetical protein